MDHADQLASPPPPLPLLPPPPPPGSAAAEADAQTVPSSRRKRSRGRASSGRERSSAGNDPPDDALLRRVGVMASASSHIQVLRAIRSMRQHPETVDALHAEANGDGKDDNVNSSSCGSRMEALERRVAAVLCFMVNDMAMEHREHANFIAKYPQVLVLDTEKNLRPVWNLLRLALPLGGERAALMLLIKNPQLLSMDVATTLRPKFDYLVDVAGLRPGDVGQMMHLDLASHIKPHVAFVSEECALGSVATAAVIRRVPRLLLEDVEATMRPALRCLSKDTALGTMEVARVIAKLPGLGFRV